MQPATEVSLFPSAPAMPATCVPCPSSSADHDRRHPIKPRRTFEPSGQGAYSQRLFDNCDDRSTSLIAQASSARSAGGAIAVVLRVAGTTDMCSMVLGSAVSTTLIPTAL